MKSANQQSILMFFDKENRSSSGSDKSQKGDEASTNNANVKRAKKRTCQDTLTVTRESKKKKFEFVRKYDEKYMELAFTVAPGSEQSPRPLCLVCAQVLSNDAMKPSKLARHFHSKHSNLKGKPVEFFERLLIDMNNQKKQLKNITTSEKSLLRASYQISLQIAKTRKPYTIGEELVKPCILSAAEEILGAEAVKKLKGIPLSNNTVQRRIEDMAIDIEQQVVEEVNKSPCFSIQLDESTDLSNCAILLCFVRYMGNTDFKEELLCCISLPGRTTGAEIFRFLDTYITAKGIDWGKCVGVCTDGAASMTGSRSGVVTKIKEVANEKMLYTHCIIHREHLASKKLSPELKNVMNNAVKIVNAIKTRPLNSRLFRTLCESMDSQHQHLLFHAEVRWLSRGRVLTRLFELREETKLFLIEIGSSLAEFMTDETWLCKLAYLADIFGRLNELNTSLQGACTNIFVLRNKTDAFKKKLAMWNRYVLEENIVMFPTLNDYMSSVDVNNKELLSIVGQHLNELRNNFDHYFPQNEDPRQGNLWINNPFYEDVDTCNLKPDEKESLLELCCDSTLKSRFKKESLSQFWISLYNEYPSLSDRAIKLLSVFSTSYLCEKSFSSLVLIKTKQRNRLDAAAELRVAETSLIPRLHLILETKQQQSSH